MAHIETQSLSKTVFKPTVWKRYIDDIFSLWDISKPDMVDFFKFTEQVNLLHPTALLAMKLTAEISDTKTIFFETVVYQGTTFNEKWEKAIIDVKTHFKRKPSCIYISPLKSGWWTEAGHTILKQKLLLEVKLTKGSSAPEKKKSNKKEKEILPFVTQYKPLVSIIQEALMKIVISYKTNHYLANFLKNHLTFG